MCRRTQFWRTDVHIQSLNAAKLTHKTTRANRTEVRNSDIRNEGHTKSSSSATTDTNWSRPQHNDERDVRIKTVHNTRNNNVSRTTCMQACFAAIWLEQADGPPSLRGSTHRLNGTWTILRKTFSTGLGSHVKHGTWQLKQFKWPANLSIVPCPRPLPYQMAHISAKCHNVQTHTQTVKSSNKGRAEVPDGSFWNTVGYCERSCATGGHHLYYYAQFVNWQDFEIQYNG